MLKNSIPLRERSLDDLKTALAEAIAQTQLDSDSIQAITAEILRRDSKNIRFSADAGIIARLGQELVGKQETAVAELIKNSYDADATEVVLTFSHTNRRGGTLLISDNGVGMTQEQLVNGFMRLSSNEKVNENFSTRYERRRAGRKGIGRFAVQRLGTRLTLTTQIADIDYAIRLSINWDDFQSGVDLASVSSQIERVPKSKKEGTDLFIEALRESWTETAQLRVYRYSSELLQPFKLNKFKKPHEIANAKPFRVAGDPGFNVIVQNKDSEQLKTIASQDETIFENAVAVIEAYVNKEGEGVWSIESKILGINEEIEPIGTDRNNQKPFANLANVSLKAYYYIWRPANFVPRALYKTLYDLGREQGGVRVFRNGFRVSPYGDRANDWLGLDFSYAARRFLPAHSNVNFFGFVELDDPNGDLFQERSSREGLIETDAFEELRDFAYRVLTAAVLRVAEARSKKQKASQTNWQREEEETHSAKTEEEDLVDAVADLENALKVDITTEEFSAQTSNNNTSSPQDHTEAPISDDSNSTAQNLNVEDIKAKAERVRVAVAKALDSAKEREEFLLEENGMFRVLASLGLVIGEFTHEVRQTLGAAQGNADDILSYFSKGVPEYTIAEQLSANVKRFRDYANYFDRTVSGNSNRTLSSLDLRKVARRFVEAMRPAANRVGVDIYYEPTDYDLFTPPMHGSEINSLLFNFYSNSLKAISRTQGKGRGKLLIRVGSENSRVYLEVADNGDGISENIQDRIFNAFFTTASPASRSQPLEDEAVGSGLGLKIVQDIVHAYNGEVYLTTAPDGYTTCFRVEFALHQSEENEN
ncbi:sensor histidine kinase [Spirosoma pomorum]